MITRLNRVFLGLLLVSAFISITSCGGPDKVFEDYSNIVKESWHQDSLVSFDINIDQVEQPLNLGVTLRYGLTYAYTNVYINYRVTKEDGTLVKSELEEVVLFDPKTGKPLGSGMSDVFDIESNFLESYNFPEAGKYAVSFQQYMRVEELPDIVSVGLKVTESGVSN
ncbi:MAG: gliding motility lipoprotein GldH [bacterium]|nr:gliding motility lipoprotein GldH [bacterium]